MLKRSTQIACAAESWLSPMLMQLWSARRSEHLTASAIVDAIKALATSPQALPNLIQRLLPAIVEVLQLQQASNTEHESRAHVSGGDTAADEPPAVDPLMPALEMLEICLKRWPPHDRLPPHLISHVLPLLLPVLATVCDYDALRVGASCLSRLLKRAPRMQADEQQALSLMEWPPMMARMLRPTLNEELIESVTPLVGQLATSAPAVLDSMRNNCSPRSSSGSAAADCLASYKRLSTFSMVVLTPALERRF